MERDEFERKLRYRMCIPMALESLMICYAAIKLIERDIMKSWELLYYHYHSPGIGILVSIFIVLAAGFILPAAFTILSMRFKRFYRIYEALHFITGAAMLMFWLFNVYIGEIIDIYLIMDNFYYIVLGILADYAAAFLGLFFFLHSRICIYLFFMIRSPKKGAV